LEAAVAGAAAHQSEQGMTMKERKLAPATAAKEMFDDLQRLIEAIDRRVPQLQRPSEARIAQEAADLRQRAVALMRAIEAAVEHDS
jgi:hypothetical protein